MCFADIEATRRHTTPVVMGARGTELRYQVLGARLRKRDQGRRSNMMQMTDMPIAMMWGMGLIWLLVIIFLLLGIAAFIKYLRS